MFEKVEAHARRISYHLGRGVKVGNQRFKLRGYYASRLATSDVRHEPCLLTVLRTQLDKRPGTFVDVGVNVGQTLLKVLGLDRNRAYVGFEPQIACCYNVQQFIRLNGLGNATVLPIALSDSNSIMTFYSRGEYDEMASLMTQNDVTGVSPVASHVQARIGDEVLRELGVEEVCAIKIDVEGAELRVLHGLPETLRANRPPVIFEVLPNFHGLVERIMHPPQACVQNQASADAIYGLFNGAGYDVYQIDDEGCETKIGRFELDDRINYVSSNYIAHPRA
jgi:FkbM family methyltransferase